MGHFGDLLAEGKTKRVWNIAGEPDMVLLEAKDDITAGDGAKHDIIEGKAEWATATTCNAFGLLKNLHRPLPVAFEGKHNPRVFKARKCTMLPFEVVIRRKAFGSYLKRHPHTEKGRWFYDVKCEFFLKTSGRRFGSYGFPTDDPMIVYDRHGTVLVHHPAKPIESEDSYLMSIPIEEILDQNLKINEVLEHNDVNMLFAWMKSNASEAFTLLEVAWEKVGGELIDFKVEFGVDTEGNLLLADVIDNDSWRVIIDGEHVDKQQYRDGKPLDEVAARYQLVAELTSRFVQ